VSELEAAIARVVSELRPEAKDALAALARFVDLVHTWNQKIDLTAARTPEALADVMIADALVMADTSFVARGAHLLDVGSGAGGPAIPLAILRPDLRVTMVEPLQKRVAFLRSAIGALGLAPRVRANGGRIDPNAPRTDVDADVASARATFAPDQWRVVGLALAPSALVLTTPDGVPAPNAIARRDYAWPGSRAPRTLVRFDRELG